MPVTLTNIMTIAQKNEPGDKLVITGKIFKSDKITPYPNLILYAYHTDSKGYYSKNGSETGVQKWHGHLYGWCKTDRNGYYEIHSVRPARYPNNLIPAHIHAAIKKDNGQMLWITDFVFKDDDLVNEKYLSSLTNEGGTGIVELNKGDGNSWIGKRDIVLK
jgi:protocatechuate 3,4-dioxygenase beta subunit